MPKKTMKSVKVDVECVLRANELKMSVNQYLKYLIHLSDIGRREFEHNHLRRLENVEGLLGSLTKSLSNKEVAERSLVMMLERDLDHVMKNNNLTHQLILSKFEFINAIEKAINNYMVDCGFFESSICWCNALIFNSIAIYLALISAILLKSVSLFI